MTTEVPVRTWKYRDMCLQLSPLPSAVGTRAVLEKAGFAVTAEAKDGGEQIILVCPLNDCSGDLCVDVLRQLAHCFECGYDGTVDTMVMPTSILRREASP